MNKGFLFCNLSWRSQVFSLFLLLLISVFLFFGNSCNGFTNIDTYTSSPSPSPSMQSSSIAYEPESLPPLHQPALPRRKALLGEKEIVVEMAATSEQRRMGLSWRPSMKENEGMLLVMPYREEASIWMYGMGFSLDIIWIDKGRVTGITEKIPPPKDPFDYNLPSYYSPGKTEYVLEVNGGFSERHGIKIGDEFILKEEL